MMKNLFYTFCFLLFSLLVKGQDEVPVYTDHVYNPAIKTIQLYVDPIILSDPIIPLGGSSQLHLEFDDLEGDKKNYYYTLIQCNFDWTPTDLSPFDYLTGFQEQELNKFEFSFNTNQRYTHYDLLFPNADIQPTKSGNYILKVYLDADPENMVLTRRFIVFDSKAQIVSEVHKPFDARYTDQFQEVDFNINYKGLSISNPINDVKVLLMQNFRWDNAITNLTPLFMKPNELDYTYDMTNAFPGGKEFRYFDTRSVRYRTERVKNIQAEKGVTDVILFADEVRSDQPYLFRKDIDGRFIPGIVEGFNQKSEPDYAWVNFFVPFNYPLRASHIYLFGKFTDWQLKDDFEMHYDPKLLGFTGRIYLKQGYYEYEYLTADKGDVTGSQDLIEGNSYETMNTYQVLVYYRPFGSRYDEVIAYKATDTFNR